MGCAEHMLRLGEAAGPGVRGSFLILQGTSGSPSLALGSGGTPALGSGGTPALGASGAHTRLLTRPTGGLGLKSTRPSFRGQSDAAGIGRAATGGGTRSRYTRRWRAHASVLPYAGQAFAGLSGAGPRRFKRRCRERGLQACEGIRIMEAARDYAGALIRRVSLRPPEPRLPCASHPQFPCAPLLLYPAPLVPLLPVFSCAPPPREYTHPPHWCRSPKARPAPPPPLAARRKCRAWLSEQVTAASGCISGRCCRTPSNASMVVLEIATGAGRGGAQAWRLLEAWALVGGAGRSAEALPEGLGGRLPCALVALPPVGD
ncbi:hypothetical protein P7K49_028480 [Saguinus oedipus]|uniref:Uncharacterized protein n=1 Tax=Saguinus oedipus TaxID=9490 RepID=A0ABQ9UCE5_SAGOE|nr:hypothetical protein P7K49_028480 [Saguinus oedipus]